MGLAPTKKGTYHSMLSFLTRLAVKKSTVTLLLVRLHYQF